MIIKTNSDWILLAALLHYLKVNAALPQKIIIYRDGVDDGKLAMVKDYEIPQIQKAFELTQAEYK